MPNLIVKYIVPKHFSKKKKDKRSIRNDNVHMQAFSINFTPLCQILKMVWAKFKYKSFFFLNIKGIFGNCFFLLFFVLKNNFLFLRLKNLFGNPKWTKNKNCFQNSICEGN